MNISSIWLFAVGTNVYDSVFGGSISFTHYGSDDVDYVWVIPRSDVIGSDVIGSDATKLKLRIETMTHLRWLNRINSY